MKADGVKRAIAFSQYPHWSCTTSGSSMNHLWRELKRLDMGDEFEWSLIDRWPLHDGFLNAVTKRVRMGLEEFDYFVVADVLGPLVKVLPAMMLAAVTPALLETR